VSASTVQRRVANATRQSPPAPVQLSEPLTLEQVSEIIAFYCQSPPPPGMLRWTLRTAAAYLNAHPERLRRVVHASTIGRVLARTHLRPHKSDYFLHVSDPDFFEKMHHILGVYAAGARYLFCFDECPNIQAISRRGPDVKHSDGRTSHEYVYQRNGTTDLFAFLHVATGTVAAYCQPTHETQKLIEVFTSHVGDQPADEQLHYICDNLYPHFNAEFCRAVAQLCGLPDPPPAALARGITRRQWLQTDDKRIVVHFLPRHGSWLNQVEIWFGLLRRYALQGGWFDSVDVLKTAILDFVRTWNAHLAHPFNFRYDGKGLENVVLRRFRRILSQRPEQLETLDTKFFTDISLLCIRLVDHHRGKLNPHDWNLLAETALSRRPELLELVTKEQRPRRTPRALKALDAFCQHAERIRLPETAPTQPATHH